MLRRNLGKGEAGKEKFSDTGIFFLKQTNILTGTFSVIIAFEFNFLVPYTFLFKAGFFNIYSFHFQFLLYYEFIQYRKKKFLTFEIQNIILPIVILNTQT